MKLLPAIDLYQGNAVRLLRGDYGQMSVYSERPADVALAFRRAGAEEMHLVDLEGAKTGNTPNFGLIEEIVRVSGLSVEVGGGIRSAETVARYLGAGVSRVILGTAAAQDPAFLAEMVRAYGGAIAVGMDLRDGFVAVKGWTETSGLSGEDFCAMLQEIGVQTVICTDIARDGAMRGANRALYRRLVGRFSLDFIASGGVSSLEDIAALKAIGLAGAIVGKAYYTGAIDLAEAIKAAKT